MATHNSYAGVAAWEVREKARIQGLPEDKVLEELQHIMEEYSYSWKSIDQKINILPIVDYYFVSEWTKLWTMKSHWDKASHLVQLRGSNPDGLVIWSHIISRNNWNQTSFVQILICLKVVPIRAGLGLKGIYYSYLSLLDTAKNKNRASSY